MAQLVNFSMVPLGESRTHAVATTSLTLRFAGGLTKTGGNTCAREFVRYSDRRALVPDFIPFLFFGVLSDLTMADEAENIRKQIRFLSGYYIYTGYEK